MTCRDFFVILGRGPRAHPTGNFIGVRAKIGILFYIRLIITFMRFPKHCMNKIICVALRLYHSPFYIKSNNKSTLLLSFF